MNKFGFILLLLSFPILLPAQAATKEALDKACACFNAIDFEQRDFESLSFVADSCIEEALYSNLTGVFKENNATLDDNDAMFQLAQLINAHLLANCEGFQQFAKRIAQRQVETVKQKNPSNIGLLYELNSDAPFPIFTIITEDYQALEFVWFREFDGSTRFMDGIKDYKNTVVEIVWKDLELYDATNKTYPFYKEILLIEELKTIETKARKEWVSNYKKTQKPSKKKRK